MPIDFPTPFLNILAEVASSMNPLDQNLKLQLEKSNRELELGMRWIAGEESGVIIEKARESAIGLCMLIGRPADEVLALVYSQMLLYIVKGASIDDEVSERKAG